MKNKCPLQIGVTGGIGSGKSLVCKIFTLLGTPVYDADQRAKWLTNFDEQIRSAITAIFGLEAYNDRGLDRDYIAGIVFKNPKLLEQLNQVVHPAVGKDYQQWVQDHKDDKYIIKEAAIMFESGSAANLDRIINVSAPEKLRIQRVLERDPFRSEEEIRSIIGRQMPEEERQKRADYIIHNDDNHMVIPQVLELHDLFVVYRD